MEKNVQRPLAKKEKQKPKDSSKKNFIYNTTKASLIQYYKVNKNREMSLNDCA